MSRKQKKPGKGSLPSPASSPSYLAQRQDQVKRGAPKAWALGVHAQSPHPAGHARWRSHPSRRMKISTATNGSERWNFLTVPPPFTLRGLSPARVLADGQEDAGDSNPVPHYGERHLPRQKRKEPQGSSLPVALNLFTPDANDAMNRVIFHRLCTGTGGASRHLHCYLLCAAVTRYVVCHAKLQCNCDCDFAALGHPGDTSVIFFRVGVQCLFQLTN